MVFKWLCVILLLGGNVAVYYVCYRMGFMSLLFIVCAGGWLFLLYQDSLHHKTDSGDSTQSALQAPKAASKDILPRLQ